MKLRPGLSFETVDTTPPQPNRTDVCGFVGAVARRRAAVPAAVLEDLASRGYAAGRLLGEDAALRLDGLLQLPVLCESFETFDQLFAWDSRPLLAKEPQAGDPQVVSALGAAVRAFFAEGGRRCYVVRSGNPAALLTPLQQRFKPLRSQLRGINASFDASENRITRLVVASEPLPLDARDWRGLELLFGIDDISFALLPDLADACAPLPPVPPLPADPPPPRDEVFHERRPEAPALAAAIGRRLHAPRLDAASRIAWASLIERAAAVLDNGGRAFNRSDVQLLASLPLSIDDAELPTRAGWFGRLPFSASRDDVAPLARRVQLAYPWLRTPESDDCPGGVEAPEGSLAGLLARSALQRGSFRTAARQPLRRYVSAVPAVDADTASRERFLTASDEFSLAERLCLLAPTPAGPALLSDVTLSMADAHRPACIRRLIGVVLRAAQTLGSTLAFEASNEALWRRVREQLSGLGRALAGAGALAVEPGVASFIARCGRDTMTQNDIDAGRLIAEIELLPARPLERIVVRLALRDGLAGGGRLAA
ncbi:MAG TPA: hypothetical protein VLI06_16450 [Solimonas sp.]|nr:hypothetical protein [Solimonas sp.]